MTMSTATTAAALPPYNPWMGYSRVPQRFEYAQYTSPLRALL